MLDQLLGSPLLLFLVLLFPAAACGWLIRVNADAARLSSPLQVLGLLLLSLAVAGLLWFAGAYLQSPNFTDHIEPNTAIVSWIWWEGGQIYHAVDAEERYAFLYGPLAYIATGIVYGLMGGSTFAAKLSGFVLLLAILGTLAWAVRRRFTSTWYPVVVAIGYYCVLALFFRNFSFWSKPDPFMVMGVTAGLAACVSGGRTGAWIACGVALGLAVNAKITGAVYFLPLVAWFLQRDGIGAALLIGVVAGLLAALPFLSPETISLANYIAWLQSAGGHGLSREMFFQNTAFMLFALLPVLAYFAGRIDLLRRYWLVTLASVAAIGLILVAASKPGSGPHHFLPFLPLFAFVAAVGAAENREGGGRISFWAPAAAFLLAATVKAAFALYYGLRVVNSQYEGEELVREIDSVIASYPDSNIYMGYGDGSRYVTTFVRNHLAYRGYPYLIDASAMMDFQLSGIDTPAVTIARVLNEPDAVWLIPAGQEPFALPNWYYRRTGELLFPELNQGFGEHYRKAGSTPHYDIWIRRAD
jgi:hypothetical protein